MKVVPGSTLYQILFLPGIIYPQPARPMLHKPNSLSPIRTPSPAIGSIQDFYRLGVAFQNATGRERSPGAADQLADKYRCSQVAIYKARQFAKMYSVTEMRELCLLRNQDGKPLGIGHVDELIQVKKGVDRKRLQKAAAKYGWSSRKLKVYPIANSGR